jgi:tetraacyldisaccharide 4'-kinase
MNFPLPLRLLLWPLSVLYGLVVRLRAWLYSHGVIKAKRLKGAVISVGNLTVGGTGKTPMVIWLAEKFLADGKRVAILSHGYRGTDGTSDEIELMKSRLKDRVIFGVGKERFEQGSHIEQQQAIDIFLLDDGFQHQKLARDLDIVLIDASCPLKKESLLPAGRLREPTSALHRADVVVFSRVESQEFLKSAIQKFPAMPIFPATTRLLGFCRFVDGVLSEMLQAQEMPQPVFAFCGIGNPKAFFTDIERWGVKLAGRTWFRDHHHYRHAELTSIDAWAKAMGAGALLTTEKDSKNLGDVKGVSLPLYVCKIATEVPDEVMFLSVIRRKLAERCGAAA